MVGGQESQPPACVPLALPIFCHRLTDVLARGGDGSWSAQCLRGQLQAHQVGLLRSPRPTG